jgi:uncharacterized protein YjbJ (UPF0337 family)
MESADAQAAHRGGEQPRGNAMNRDQIEGRWKQLAGSVKARWGDFTDDEIMEIDGNREKLEGKLQVKYGRTKEQAQAEVDEWLSKN